ncbi:DNA topoisomerase III [Fibrobacter sp. UWB11]|uniref:DNA topoisomerase III n=1 Tax=Fibrobacter sp. UWB11 TaxID=1896202 RepID=UPI0009294121|nr:DNA topoisomerase III [Fibrobacter sp. UWB11]SIO43749.1 DNA topoisomerase-3 [Fibrobacter sp. UWB11]
MATTKTTTKATTKTTTKKTATKTATKAAKPVAEGKTLIIAEKPSVAADLVKVLGAKTFKKETAYYESDTTIVSHAIGHLVGIADPKDIDERYKAWDMKTLPMLPEKFPLVALPTTRSHLSALGKLIKRKDVTTIINACDAGREGELIFYYIVDYILKGNFKGKTFKRLWMQSMTPAAIKDAFEHLRTEEDMVNLRNAALCRSEADWLVGMNGSRGLTAYNSSMGGFQITPCGRVQTPTLAIIVKREEERNRFVPQKFWTIEASFDNSGAGYQGKWFTVDKENGKDRVKQIFDEARAQEILAKCKGKKGSIEETTAPSQQKCGQLYDLTTLQREANNRFGFSAKTTLSIAQSLYEHYKATTYPRTDSRCLPEDYVAPVKATLGKIEGPLAKFAQEALDKNYVKRTPKVFDNSKISDHFAIIPTGVVPKGLSEAEEKIYTMICQRFIAVFFPPAQYLNTTRITTVENETFITEGKILVDPGFKAIYGKESDEESNIPQLNGNTAKMLEIDAKEDFTKPPAHYTESTLLSMMESAGKLVEDDELRDAMKERGLGTPATRAAIIEKLVSDKYVIRDGKEMIPTAKAFDLIKVLSAMNCEALTSPELTGEWEYKMDLISKGKESREAFMSGIVEMTKTMVKNIKGFKEDDTENEASFSPVNGKKVFETVSRYRTEDGIVIRKIVGGKHLTESEIIELLTKRKIGPLTGFRSKKGAEFSAVLTINDENKIEFVFDEKPEEIELGEVIGKSPVDGSDVYETLTGYVSESYVKKEPSGITLPKILLGKELPLDDIKKLLAGEKTSLIKGFRSNKTRRLFDAYLTLVKGKLKFEFPPREFKPRRFAKKTSG